MVGSNWEGGGVSTRLAAVRISSRQTVAPQPTAPPSPAHPLSPDTSPGRRRKGVGSAIFPSRTHPGPPPCELGFGPSLGLSLCHPTHPCAAIPPQRASAFPPVPPSPRLPLPKPPPPPPKSLEHTPRPKPGCKLCTGALRGQSARARRRCLPASSKSKGVTPSALAPPQAPARHLLSRPRCSSWRRSTPASMWRGFGWLVRRCICYYTD